MPTGWWWSRIVAVGLVLAGLYAPALAGERNERRLAVELAVMFGDVALIERSDTSARHHGGLVARLNSSLSTLRLLVRQAGGRPEVPVEAMRSALAGGNLSALRAALDLLAHEHPLDVTVITAAAVPEAQVARGRLVYQELCQGCHDDPEVDVDLPARDLFVVAASRSRTEFVARLFAGLRGTPATGLDNPFGESDIAALYAYFRAGRLPAGQ